MPVPVVYSVNLGNPNLTFNFTDWIAGSGQANVYAGVGTISGSTVYYLHPSSIVSDPVYTQDQTNTGGAYQEVLDLDFDSTVVQNVTFEGQSIINYTHYLIHSAPNPSWMWETFTIYRVRSGVETQMGTVTSKALSAEAGTITERECLPFTITKTNFVKGDILRLNVKVYRYSTVGGAPANYKIYHDPENTAVAGLDTTLLLSLPMLTARA